MYNSSNRAWKGRHRAARVLPQFKTNRQASESWVKLFEYKHTQVLSWSYVGLQFVPVHPWTLLTCCWQQPEASFAFNAKYGTTVQGLHATGWRQLCCMKPASLTISV
jgi:hypothetical protein